MNIDGKPDLIVANHGSNSVSVLLNSGIGTFPTQTTFATGTSPFSVATADVNRDGKPDVLVANNGSNTVGVLLNTGSGTFQPQQTFAAGSGPIAIASAEINGDGKLDIVVANYNGNTASVLLGNGDGSFQPQTTFAVGAGPRSIAVADINDDGREDLIVGNSAANSASVLLGDVPPAIQSISFLSPAGPNTVDSMVSYTVTFSKPVTGVDPTDFVLATTGTVTASTPVVVTGSGASYTVAVNGIAGSGALGLNFVDNTNVRDSLGNPLGRAPSLFQAEQTVSAGTAPVRVITADVNGDGNLDLVVANYRDNSVSILLGNGNGTFQPQRTSAAGSNPLTIAAADLNGDGKTDLLVADQGSRTVALLLGNGDGTFQAPRTIASLFGGSFDGSFPQLAVSDVNGDGKLDVVFAGASPDSSVFTLLGNGNGTFQPPLSVAAGLAYSLAVADVNGDGKPDIVLANGESSTVSVALGNGNGTFQAARAFPSETNLYDIAQALTVADVNGDGKPDLIVADNHLGEVSVLLNNGDGTFQAPFTFAGAAMPSSITVSDVNGDGTPDIIVVGNFNGLNVLLGNGNGTFQSAQSIATAYPGGSSLSAADLNGDGYSDLVLTNAGRAAFLLGGSSANLAGPVYNIAQTSDTISGNAVNDRIFIKKDVNGTDIDWTNDTSVGMSIGQLRIDDPNGLTINANSALTLADIITLDYTNGNPLPNIVHFNGAFAITSLQGTNPLAGTTFDIGRSAVFIGYTSSDPLAAVLGYLRNGYNAGAWNGTPTATTGAITSAAAQTNPNHNTAIGYADSADGQGVNTFTNFNTLSNSIELTYTLIGDANLSGNVNSADLQALLSRFNLSGAWDQGDFNYSGNVNSADLQALLSTFNTSLGSQAALMAVAAAAAVGTPSGAGSSGSKASGSLVPAIQPTGTTGPAVHHPHSAKVTARKRR